MIVAAIDVGTNTALLTVAEASAGGALRLLYEEERFVRLGEGVDADRLVRPEALERLCRALQAYRARAEALGAEAIVVGATSASRDARNREAVVDRVRRETGLSYEILSGDEEACWSFAGALSAFPEAEGPCALVDIGGGSTELVVGTAVPGAAPVVTFRKSLQVGSVRLTERFFTRQPPAPAEVEAARAYVYERLAAVAAPLRPEVPLVGAAGTVVALALLDAGVASWQAQAPGPRVLTSERVRAWSRRLLAAPRDAVLALQPSVMAGRADVFPAGVLVLEVLLTQHGLPECRVSPRGLRHGLVLRHLSREHRNPR